MAWWFGEGWQDDWGSDTPSPRDRPLTFHWRARTDDPIGVLGLTKASNGGIEIARNRIIAEALLAHEEGRWVSYSRRRTFYTGRQRYNGTTFTFRNVLHAVEELIRLDLLEEQRAIPGQLGRQSRFRASPRLAEAFTEVDLEYDLTGLIRLKDMAGHLIDYRDTDATWQMSRELQAINADLGSIKVELPGSDIIRLRHHLLIDGAYYRPTAPALHRVFNRASFSKGGRAYGWWQHLPKARRQQLLIDGEPVSEPDFAQFHPAILYALRGCRLAGDAYETDRFPRELGKLAFNVAVNTRTIQGTIAALANKSSWPLPRSGTVELLDALARRNAPIADDLHADRGIALMNLDARIIIRATKQCLEAGIPVLPVHDSMLTPRRYEGRVAEIMEASAEAVLKRPNPCRVSVSSVSVPQMPWSVPLPLPPLSFSSSAPSQLDLFRWAPEASSFGIQIRDLRQSLGLSQTSLASKLGCRQPHVANVESGRHRLGDWARHRFRDLLREVETGQR